VVGRVGGWSPKATRRDDTVVDLLEGVLFGVLGLLWLDSRSSELKTWPFWRTRARGSAMV